MSRSPRRNQARRTRGFSLIEVVVASGVFALVAGVLFSALWGGRTQLARFEKTGSEQERMLALRRVLTGLIEATTVAGTSQDPGAEVYSGGGQRAVFYSTPSDRGQTGGLFRVELEIVRNEQAGNIVSKLILRRQAVTNSTPAAAIEATELIALPRALVFRYSPTAGPISNRQPAQWSETWTEIDKLPARVQLADLDGPLLTVTVNQSKDPRCILRRGVQMLAGGECLVR
jgi:prepilin-type N-terminal cleavage/methylation domain-containing protein